jgi:hypothetical protein
MTTVSLFGNIGVKSLSKEKSGVGWSLPKEDHHAPLNQGKRGLLFFGPDAASPAGKAEVATRIFI